MHSPGLTPAGLHLICFGLHFWVDFNVGLPFKLDFWVEPHIGDMEDSGTVRQLDTRTVDQ